MCFSDFQRSFHTQTASTTHKMNSTSMDQLLGTALLAAPNAAISTEDGLKEKDLVLFYFSASW